MFNRIMSSTAATLKAVTKKAAETVTCRELEEDAGDNIFSHTTDGVLGGGTIGFMVGAGGRIVYDIIRTSVMTHSAFVSGDDYQSYGMNAVHYGFMGAAIAGTFLGALSFGLSTYDCRNKLKAVQVPDNSSTDEATQEQKKVVKPSRRHGFHQRHASAPANLTPIAESPLFGQRY